MQLTFGDRRGFNGTMHDKASIETITAEKLRVGVVPESAVLIFIDLEFVGEVSSHGDWALRETYGTIHLIGSLHV